MRAAQNGETGVVKNLLEKGYTDIHAKDKAG